MKRNLNKILAAREERYQFRLALQEDCNLPLVVLTLNIPGPDKLSPLIDKVFPGIITDLKQVFIENNIRPKKEISQMSPAGPEAFFVLQTDFRCEEIKEKMVLIEEKHYLGRLLDLDVYNADGIALARDDLDKEPRKCLICDQTARECIIERRHSPGELKAKIDSMLKKYLTDKQGSV